MNSTGSCVHPFTDGNARAGLLCLYYVLRRDGVVIDLASPVLRTVRRAGDMPGALDLIRLIEVLIAATGRRVAAKAGQRQTAVFPT